MADSDHVGERHIEMTWHCAGCHHANLGRYTTCTECGKPKQDEPYEMPADTASAATVTDAALVRMATAGPNWQCAYCGSSERAGDGSCGNCGASALKRAAVAAKTKTAASARAKGPLWQRAWVPWLIVGVLVSAFGAGWLALWNAHRPRTFAGVIARVSWEQVIDVERYANRDHEDFQENIPAGATDVVSVGQKVHHTEQVFDHTGVETYTEQVPDGYTTESYVDTSDCGERTCTATAPDCHEECKSSNNGFASCHQVCSGGTSSCTPAPCATKTRQVPRTRAEIKTRQVPVYRSEPRYAEAFHYKAWDWQHDRTVRAAGSDATGLSWPEHGARDSGLADGERERETRHAHYEVTVRYAKTRWLTFAVPTPAELAPYRLNSTHRVRIAPAHAYVDDRLVANPDAKPDDNPDPPPDDD